jgi:(p)ppGpp synthase/HD superfamily hydrolase
MGALLSQFVYRTRNTPVNQEKYQRMLDIVKKYHAGQTREGGVKPYWPHCERVALLLQRALEKSKETSKQIQEQIILSALGHDLYEDTAINRQEIVDDFGVDVDRLIEEVTNRFGDNQVERYAEKLKHASELALLIKLADLFDNYQSGYMALPANGYQWTKTFLWPILETQWAIVKTINFRQFPLTAQFLMQAVAAQRKMLKQALLAGAK